MGAKHFLLIMTIQIKKILQIAKTPREGEACVMGRDYLAQCPICYVDF